MNDTKELEEGGLKLNEFPDFAPESNRVEVEGTLSECSKYLGEFDADGDSGPATAEKRFIHAESGGVRIPSHMIRFRFDGKYKSCMSDPGSRLRYSMVWTLTRARRTTPFSPGLGRCPLGQIAIINTSQ